MNPTVRPTMSPTGVSCFEEEVEADEDALGDEDGGREKMVEMVAVVVVGRGKCVVGMTMVIVREVERFVKDATFVENGGGVGSAVITGVLDDVGDPGLFSPGHASCSPQGSMEQQPWKLLTEQA